MLRAEFDCSPTRMHRNFVHLFCAAIAVLSTTASAVSNNVEATVEWNTFYVNETGLCQGPNYCTVAIQLRLYCSDVTGNHRWDSYTSVEYKKGQLKQMSDSGTLHKVLGNRNATMPSCKKGYKFTLTVGMSVKQPNASREQAAYLFEFTKTLGRQDSKNGASSIITSAEGTMNNDSVVAGMFNLTISFRCAQFWFGDYCNIYCKQSRQYACDNVTGVKLCRENWYPLSERLENCSKDAKEACNVHCVANRTGIATCGLCGIPSCEDGYELSDNGTYCYLPCDPPCVNGGACMNSTCFCKPGYSGFHCDNGSTTSTIRPKQTTRTSTYSMPSTTVSTRTSTRRSTSSSTSATLPSSPIYSTPSSKTIPTLPTPMKQPNKSNNRKEKLRTGAIVGIVIVAIAAVLAILYIGYRVNKDCRDTAPRETLIDTAMRENTFAIENPVYMAEN